MRWKLLAVKADVQIDRHARVRQDEEAYEFNRRDYRASGTTLDGKPDESSHCLAMLKRDCPFRRSTAEL